MSLRSDAQSIISASIRAVQPDAAVQRALRGREFPGRVVLAAAGKAAWQMAKAARDCLGDRISAGVVVTKYGHVSGPIPGCTCYEAGHPVPDENSFQGAQAVLDLVPGEELQDVTSQLLSSGADIVEMNTIRKRLSAVKGGRFAQLCAPARVFAIVLSDILGDPLDMIASGPACADQSTCEQALAIAEKYRLTLTPRAKELLAQETPKALDNVETQITGSVRELCAAAASAARELGYEPVILTDLLACQAREAGAFLASIARTHQGRGKKLAFLAGGETVVKLTGSGRGGRNQELALSAAQGIEGLDSVLVFSLGSDGTDGPTDAAGGIVDGRTASVLREQGLLIHQVLEDNDAYHALAKADGLIVTGPTGTNVNDVAVALIGG